MTFSSSAFGQLRYIEESTPGVTPGAGNAVNLRMTSPTMKAAVSTVKSEEIRSDRLSTGSTQSDLNLDGGFNFELSAKEYDPFFEGLLGMDFVHYGTDGLGAAFEATTTATTISAAIAPTGGSAFTTLEGGSWIKLVPPTGASQAVKDYFADAWFKVSSSVAPTSTLITLDAGTPIVAPGIVIGQAGYKISQSAIENAGTFKTFSMEYGLHDINQFFLFTGMQVGNMELSLDVGSITKGSFGFIGMEHDVYASTQLPGSPVASQTYEVMNSVTDLGMIFEAGTNVLSGGSFIKSMKLSINNNPRGQKALGVFGNAGVGLGELALSGSMDVYLEDATYYQKWLRGTNTNLAVGMADAAGNGYIIEFGKVTFKDGGLNPGGRNDDVMLSLPFDAFYDATGQRGVRITRAVAA